MSRNSSVLEAEETAAKGETAVNFNDITQKVKETIKIAAKETEKAAKEVKNKLSEQMESETVKKAVDKSKKVSCSLWSFWKLLPRKTRLVVTAVIVFIIAFALMRGRASASVSSPAEAQALVEEMYSSEAGYSISYGRKITMSKTFFEGKVGEKVSGGSGKAPMIDAYDFEIQNPASGVSGYIYVSEKGRIIADNVGQSGTYRVR